MKQRGSGERIEVPVPANFRWPGGQRIAVLFGVAFEGWSDGKWPGIGPMGNPLQAGVPDWNAVRWAEYGWRRGIHRILDALGRYGIKASVMVCGILAERHPETVRAIAQAGHEVVAHSYAMDVIPVYLDESQERDNIRRTGDLIERACGTRPRGWISPRGTPSARTERLLAEEGYDWHGDGLDDDVPYLVRFGERSLVSFPGTMEVNDLPTHVKHGQPPRTMLQTFEDALGYLRRAELEVGKIDPIIHAHVFGRPAGIWVYERMLATVKDGKDVWTGTHADVVDHVRAMMR